MKKFVYTLVLLLAMILSSSELHAQFSGTWSFVMMPKDSLIPAGLFALDSNHCLFAGYTSSMYEYFGNYEYPCRVYWYATSDGGKSWHPINLSNVDYVDSVTRGPFPNHINQTCTYPGSKTVYLMNPGVLRDSLSWGYSKYNIIVSNDWGEHWEKKGFPIDSSTIFPEHTFRLVSTAGGNNVFGYNRDSVKVFYSSDYAARFQALPNDKTFHNTLNPPNDTNEKGMISLAQSTFLSATAVVLAALNVPDSIYPRGLTTLVTSNGGGSWERYNYRLPGHDSLFLPGHLQFIKSTPHLYHFLTGEGASGNNEGYPNITRFRNSRPYGNVSDSYFNTSFLYSSDYGGSWTPNHSYGERRRAYEAVAKDEVWMTVSKEQSIHALGIPAKVIVRTTDNGKTWEEDENTLTIETQTFDGRIISFSDPHHGWIAAYDGRKTSIFRYVANPTSVEDDDGGSDAANATFRIKLYPNPTADKANILVPKFQSIVKVDVFDMLGRQMPSDAIINGNTATLSTAELPTGCYLTRTKTKLGTGYIMRLSVVR